MQKNIIIHNILRSKCGSRFFLTFLLSDVTWTPFKYLDFLYRIKSFGFFLLILIQINHKYTYYIQNVNGNVKNYVQTN